MKNQLRSQGQSNGRRTPDFTSTTTGSGAGRNEGKLNQTNNKANQNTGSGKSNNSGRDEKSSGKISERESVKEPKSMTVSNNRNTPDKKKDGDEAGSGRSWNVPKPETYERPSERKRGNVSNK